MAAHEKYQQNLQERFHRHQLKTILYISGANCFFLQVKLLISPEEQISSLSNPCVLF
jgi:hypothetical protein